MNIDTICLPGSIIDNMEGVNDLGTNLGNVSDGTLPNNLTSIKNGLRSDAAPDADLRPPDHTELLADGGTLLLYQK